MNPEEIDINKLNTNQLLHLVLIGMDIKIIKQEHNHFFLEKNYHIEIESNQLFKLSQNEQVIAPFHDMEEMLFFVKNH